MFFIFTVTEIYLCRKWPVKEMLSTKWFFVSLHENYLKATDCGGEIKCSCRFSPLQSQLITRGLIFCSASAHCGHSCHETCFASCCVHTLLVVWCLFLKTFRCEKFFHVSLVERCHVHDPQCRYIARSYYFCISGEDGGKSPTVLDLCCLLAMLWTSYVTLG